MKFSAVVVLTLAAQAAAFAPQPARVELGLSATALEMSANGKPSRSKKVLKTLGKVAGAVGTVALASAGAPPAALAGTKVAEAIRTAKDSKKIVGGAFAVGAVAGLIATKVASGASTKIVNDKISKVYPGAVPNKLLVSKVSDTLATKYNFGKDSLVATSLCCDEISRVLEHDFSNVYTDNFAMGGLAGFPFPGAVSFGAMASHIPDGGSCLIVYGPHVGVDSKGNVGTTERRGKENGGACCGSAIAASGYVEKVYKGEIEKNDYPTEVLDYAQTFVGNLLLPHAERLEKADNKMQELPYALYDAQKELIHEIVTTSAGAVAGNGKIAVLGGIQINTPPGESDYYLPLSFEVYDNTGSKIEDLALP